MPMLKRNYKQGSMCALCGCAFQATGPRHKFCGTACKSKYPYASKKITTESQYKNISGNWDRYFSRILYKRRKEQGLTKEVLIKIIKRQNFCCALTGKTLTCILSVEDGPCRTNASIDRIEAGGPYSEDNIQLVCRAVNSFRNDMPIAEFVEWCRAVVQTNTKPEIAHANEAA